MDNNNVAGTTNETNNEKRMEKLRDFGKKNRTDLNNFIAFNDKVEMSSQERNFWEKRIKPLVKAFDESITYLVETIPMQEKGMEEINTLLAEKPIINIKVELEEVGKFSVILVTTGEILMTGNKEEVKGCINGLYIAQQATASKVE